MDSLVWYMKDDEFEQPKAYAIVKIYCPTDSDPLGSV